MSTRRLGKVQNPVGRLDVMLYRLAHRTMERIEQEQGLAGLCENILPIVEQVIVRHVPGRNLIPDEISALMRVYELNQGRLS